MRINVGIGNSIMYNTKQALIATNLMNSNKMRLVFDCGKLFFKTTLNKTHKITDQLNLK
jgi:hypothetical protein